MTQTGLFGSITWLALQYLDQKDPEYQKLKKEGFPAPISFRTTYSTASCLGQRLVDREWGFRLDETLKGNVRKSPGNPVFLSKQKPTQSLNWLHVNDTTLTAESKEELKSLLMKKESEKAGLKLNIQKMKIMASGPITSWQVDGETRIFGGLKNLWRCDCSHEIKRCLLLERKIMTNLDNTSKSRNISLPTKVHLVKAIWFFQ